MKTSIVLGLMFGDEGKGLTTSYLVSKAERPLVIRFSGGHQAGHTVVHNGNRHVFSNFGSGTMQHAPTYWSKYCTFYPHAVLNEYNHLRQYNPLLFVDGLCPVTTPFDKLHNQRTERDNKHGSCGVGFGSTIQRQESYYKLFVQDLYFESVYKAKLQNIVEYYKNVLPENWEEIFVYFLEEIEQVKRIIETEIRIEDYTDIIFEGSQGILLDMDFGFFPNVTRSNTTSKNALKIIHQFDLPQPEIYYITRSYQTRHGNGFMTNENSKPLLINNEKETNVIGGWQGKFRIGAMDIDLINYAIKCDSNFSKRCRKNLVVTCLDQTGHIIDATINGGLKRQDIYSIIESINCNFENIYFSESDNSKLTSKEKQLLTISF